MDAFVWSDSFLTGIDTIDREHRGLVDLINRLGRGDDHGEDPLPMDAVFDRLYQYACTHFVNEEWLMQQVGCDASFFSAHCAEHARFLQQVQSLRKMAEDATAEQRSALFRFLFSWLAHHVLGTDQVAAAQINAILAGSTPAEAAAAARSSARVREGQDELSAVRERLRKAAAELKALVANV